MFKEISLPSNITGAISASKGDRERLLKSVPFSTSLFELKIIKLLDRTITNTIIKLNFLKIEEFFVYELCENIFIISLVVD